MLQGPGWYLPMGCKQRSFYRNEGIEGYKYWEQGDGFGQIYWEHVHTHTQSTSAREGQDSTLKLQYIFIS